MPKLAACGSDSGHIFYNANFQNLRVTTIPANASENKTGIRRCFIKVYINRGKIVK